MTLDISVVENAIPGQPEEWLLEIIGEGELDGECHVMLLLSTTELRQLQHAVNSGPASRA